MGVLFQLNFVILTSGGGSRKKYGLALIFKNSKEILAWKLIFGGKNLAVVAGRQEFNQGRASHTPTRLKNPAHI